MTNYNYHRTDGGAEYYCVDNIKGTNEGDIRSAILRVDGGEIEVLKNKLDLYAIDLVIN